jgi:hypothetical protein
MRALSSIRHIACIAALAATAVAPAAAAATQIDVTALNGSFANGDGGWSSTSACAPLCTVTNTIDSGAGATTPGSASVVYTTLSGLLGGLASGTSTWTSPAFTWTDPTPDSAVLTIARRASISSLLAVGGSASVRVQLRDQTTGAVTTVANDGISSADSAFASHSLALDPTLLLKGHGYRLLVTTNLAAAALLTNIRVSFDDIALTATVTPPTTSVSPGTGSGDPGGSGGDGPGSATAPGTPAAGGTALRLSAATTVRFSPGRRFTLRVRALRAGKPVANAVVTWRVGTTVRRVATGRDGYASLTLLRRARSALRITVRTGAANATTWARPR